MITDSLLKLFKNTHIRYYGKIPKIIITNNNNNILVDNKRTKINEKTIISLIEFYEWRLKRSISGSTPIRKSDIKHLELLYKKEKITINSIAYIFNVSNSSFRKNINNGFGFSQALGNIEDGKNKKIKSHKIDKFPKIEKNKKFPKIVKNKKWEFVIDSEIHSYESILGLITELIKDSKDNLISGENDYYEDSKKFLMNKNGLLEYYLEFINNIDVEECLYTLRVYAENH